MNSAAGVCVAGVQAPHPRVGCRARLRSWVLGKAPHHQLKVTPEPGVSSTVAWLVGAVEGAYRHSGLGSDPLLSCTASAVPGCGCLPKHLQALSHLPHTTEGCVRRALAVGKERADAQTLCVSSLTALLALDLFAFNFTYQLLCQLPPPSSKKPPKKLPLV